MPARRTPTTRLAVDIGGTFTDVAAFDEKSGRLLLGKALSTPQRLVTKTVYRGCDDGLRVQALKLTGTDHGWPGRKGRRLPRRNPSKLNATTELLRFVRSSHRP